MYIFFSSSSTTKGREGYWEQLRESRSLMGWEKARDIQLAGRICIYVQSIEKKTSRNEVTENPSIRLNELCDVDYTTQRGRVNQEG